MATIQDDLHVVESFAPHIVILQLGTYDLSRLDPLLVGSAIEDLDRTLHDSYNVQPGMRVPNPLSRRGLCIQCASPSADEIP